MKLDEEESKRVGVKVMRPTEQVQPKVEEKKEKKSKKREESSDETSDSISFRDEE